MEGGGDQGSTRTEWSSSEGRAERESERKHEGRDRNPGGRRGVRGWDTERQNQRRSGAETQRRRARATRMRRQSREWGKRETGASAARPGQEPQDARAGRPSPAAGPGDRGIRRSRSATQLPPTFSPGRGNSYQETEPRGEAGDWRRTQRYPLATRCRAHVPSDGVRRLLSGPRVPGLGGGAFARCPRPPDARGSQLAAEGAALDCRRSLWQPGARVPARAGLTTRGDRGARRARRVLGAGCGPCRRGRTQARAPGRLGEAGTAPRGSAGLRGAPSAARAGARCWGAASRAAPTSGCLSSK